MVALGFVGGHPPLRLSVHLSSVQSSSERERQTMKLGWSGICPSYRRFHSLQGISTLPRVRHNAKNISAVPGMSVELCNGTALLDDNGEPLLHIVFVSPQIHWNTGNIGRTCLGLGARLHLVGPLGFSLDERQVRRAGLDYWQYVDLRVYDDWSEFSKEGGALQSLGGTRLFFTKFGNERAIDINWKAEQTPIVLIFGSEVDGMTSIKSWMDCEGKDERRVAFPMVDSRFRSFNLSTSASMALWDAYKSLCLARELNPAPALQQRSSVNVRL